MLQPLVLATFLQPQTSGGLEQRQLQMGVLASFGKQRVVFNCRGSPCTVYVIPKIDGSSLSRAWQCSVVVSLLIVRWLMLRVHSQAHMHVLIGAWTPNFVLGVVPVLFPRGV